MEQRKKNQKTPFVPLWIWENALQDHISSEGERRPLSTFPLETKCWKVTDRRVGSMCLIDRLLAKKVNHAEVALNAGCVGYRSPEAVNTRSSFALTIWNRLIPLLTINVPIQPSDVNSIQNQASDHSFSRLVSRYWMKKSICERFSRNNFKIKASDNCH